MVTVPLRHLRPGLYWQQEMMWHYQRFGQSLQLVQRYLWLGFLSARLLVLCFYRPHSLSAHLLALCCYRRHSLSARLLALCLYRPHSLSARLLVLCCYRRHSLSARLLVLCCYRRHSLRHVRRLTSSSSFAPRLTLLSACRRWGFLSFLSQSSFLSAVACVLSFSLA